MQIGDEELALMSAIRDDPRNVGLRMAYSHWLNEEGQDAKAEVIRLCCEDSLTLFRATMRYGLNVGEGEARKRRKRIGELLTEYGQGWIGQLPFGIYCNDRYLLGFPLALCLYSNRERGFAGFNDRASSVSPLHLIEIGVDVSPQHTVPGSQDRWWGGSFRDFMTQPGVARASKLSLGFRTRHYVSEKGRGLSLSPHLRMGSALDIIRALAEAIDPIRTPWVEMSYASRATEKLAEKVLLNKLEYRAYQAYWEQWNN